MIPQEPAILKALGTLYGTPTEHEGSTVYNGHEFSGEYSIFLQPIEGGNGRTDTPHCVFGVEKARYWAHLQKLDYNHSTLNLNSEASDYTIPSKFPR